MKRISLHIIFLLGFLFVLTESTAQENIDFFEQKWRDLNYKIENSDLNDVRSSFEEFAQLTRNRDQDSILTEGILLIGDYYKNHGEFGERIKWYQFAIDSLCSIERSNCVNIRREIADIYSSIDQYGKAINLHKINLQFLENKKYYEAASLENSLIAKNYTNQGNTKKSEEFYLKSLRSAEKSKSVFYTILAHNNLGFFYSLISDFSHAEKHYLIGIRILEDQKSINEQNNDQLALLKGNLGSNYLKTGKKVEEGINFLIEDIKHNLENNGLDLAINASAELAKYYYENQKYDKASEVLLWCLDKKDDLSKDQISSGIIVPIYYWLFKVNLEQQKNRIALDYFKEYDSLKTERDERREDRRLSIEKSLLENILNVQLEYQEQQIKLKDKENEVLAQKNEHFFYRLIFGIVSFLILAISIILYSRKRISLMRVKKELAENKFEVEKLEKEKTKIELQYKNKDLTDFAIDISRKQEVLTDVKEKLTGILKSKTHEEDTKKEIKTLINYTNNNMLVDEQLKEFQENVEEVNYKFLDQLSLRYPDLTELDKNICGFIRLGLSNKEIATMRNVSYKAIRMSRYRIRKKLDLPAEINLVEFLKSIE